MRNNLIHKSKHRHTPHYKTCSYLRSYLDPLTASKKFKSAVKVLRNCNVPFDSIAFCGMSGALIAPPIAHRLKKPLIMVRKTTVGCHSQEKVEGNIKSERYIIIDDLTCSGRTSNRIQYEVHKFAPDARCVGFLGVNYLSDNGDGGHFDRLEPDLNFYTFVDGDEPIPADWS